jgi:hypothetical protein
MNPFTYIRLRQEQRERTAKAFALMASSGVIRHADNDIRRVMSKKELEKFLTEKDEQA